MTKSILNFELTAFYDCHQSSLDYEDFINESGFRIGENFLIIGDKYAPKWKKSHLQKMKKMELVELAIGIQGNYNAECYTKADLINDLLCVDNEDFYKWYVSENGWRDSEYEFISRGYCQGDAVKVIFAQQKGYEWVTEQFIDHLLWDTPVFARLEFLNGSQEIMLCDYLSDSYTWEADDLVKNFKERYNGAWKNQIVDWLENNLPDTLVYMH